MCCDQMNKQMCCLCVSAVLCSLLLFGHGQLISKRIVYRIDFK